MLSTKSTLPHEKWRKSRLDQEVNAKWIHAFKNVGTYLGSIQYVRNKPPSVFEFRGDQVTVQARNEDEAKLIMVYFQQWLPSATASYKEVLRIERDRREKDVRTALLEKQRVLETKQRILSAVQLS
jgi:hypothetical protein